MQHEQNKFDDPSLSLSTPVSVDNKIKTGFSAMESADQARQRHILLENVGRKSVPCYMCKLAGRNSKRSYTCFS